MSAPSSNVMAMTTDTDLAPTTEWALSPSRAMDFKTCALRYRFRVIDRLRSSGAVVGTKTHMVLGTSTRSATR